MAGTFRADHVGSLLRPPELLEARQAHREGRLSDAALRQIEDASILKALELQKQAGVDVFTDGEYRRQTFLDPITQGLDGVATSPGAPISSRGGNIVWQGPNADAANTAMMEYGLSQVVNGKLRRAGRMTGPSGAFLKQHAAGPWKMTIPGVTMRTVAIFRPGVTDRFYATPAELTSELIGFVQAEVRDLLDEGMAYLQLDSLLYVGAALPGMQLEEVIAADNAVIDVAKAGGATVGLHMCRGNNRSAWLSAGTYEHLQHVFDQLHADRFLLEYDTERSGGFEPLRFVPKDKMVVLGLISSKLPQLETVDELRRRIDEAARYVPFENLAISPQCGFASGAPGNLITWDDMRRKLELVVETARKVWS